MVFPPGLGFPRKNLVYYVALLSMWWWWYDDDNNADGHTMTMWQCIILNKLLIIKVEKVINIAHTDSPPLSVSTIGIRAGPSQKALPAWSRSLTHHGVLNEWSTIDLWVKLLLDLENDNEELSWGNWRMEVSCMEELMKRVVSSFQLSMENYYKGFLGFPPRTWV